ncbi:MAG: hypothetical protein ABJB49_07995 [Nitrospirota bacterium]
MADFIAAMHGALIHDDGPQMDHLREIGFTLLAKWPGSLSEQALDLLARACVRRNDEQGLAKIAEDLPSKEIVPANANLSMREMAHLQMVRGYVHRQRRDFAKSRRCFQAVVDLTSYFGEADMQALAQKYLDEMAHSEKLAVSGARA